MKLLQNLMVFICLTHASRLSSFAQSQQGCLPTADVIFLLDGSDSISTAEFQQQIDLMSRFVNHSNIGPDTVRVGFVVVSSSVGAEFPLYGSLNRDMVMAGISNISQQQEGSRTDLGLVQMEQMFGFQGRPGVLRIGVIMTDGRAKFERATEVEASVVKSSGIFLIAIGVGRLIKFGELEKIASTASNAYSLVPIDMSSKLLTDTVEVLGRESCAGHAATLLDLLKSETNPNAKQMADMPFQALSNKVRQETVPPTIVNPGIPAINPNQPLQLNIDGMNFPDKNIYNLLNASLLQTQQLGQGLLAGQSPQQMPTTTTTEATTEPSILPVTYQNPSITTGVGINFNGGIADRIPEIQPAPPSNALVPHKLPSSPTANLGASLGFSEPLLQVPVMKETIASNVLTEKYPVPVPKDVASAPVVQHSVNKPIIDVMPDQCSKGRYVNGVGHAFVPNSCTNFYQCIRDNGKVHVEVARCPFETFYDDKSAVCKYYEATNCWRDPCLNQNADSYKHAGNCRAYWSCSTGSSVPTCCPLGSSHSPGIGCVRNVTCQDTCMDFGNINTVASATKCRLLPMESNDKFFFEKVSGLGWMVRSCPPGSRFNHNLCNCNKPDKVFKPSCRPELYLTFEDGVVDNSGNHLAMGNKNVRVEMNSGQFDGLSHLTLWRFSGVSFGQKVKITFRFRTSVWAPKGRLMHILSNCCYGCGTVPQPSIDIAVIPGENGGIAVLSASTMLSGEKLLYIHYEDTFTGWNRLTYTYDGQTLTGTVNSATETTNIIGDIQSRPYPLMIGSCDQTGAYQGLLDDFEFYMCTAH